MKGGVYLSIEGGILMSINDIYVILNWCKSGISYFWMVSIEQELALDRSKEGNNIFYRS